MQASGQKLLDIKIPTNVSNSLPLHVPLVPTVVRSLQDVDLLLRTGLGHRELQPHRPFLDDGVLFFHHQADAPRHLRETEILHVPDVVSQVSGLKARSQAAASGRGDEEGRR
jgi:hypothetical protein